VEHVVRSHFYCRHCLSLSPSLFRLASLPCPHREAYTLLNHALGTKSASIKLYLNIQEPLLYLPLRQMESTPLRRPLGRLIELNSGRHNGKHKSAKSNKSKAFPKKCNQNRSFASSWASGKIFIKCCLTILSVRYESKIRYTQQQQQQQQLSSQASEHPGSIKRPPKDTQI